MVLWASVLRGIQDTKRSISMTERPSLSPRELEVLKWLKLGKTSWDISVILNISERTVNYHVNNIVQKLGVSTRMQAVSEAFANDL
jgi:DNA-binding CsgD family transcriptional regulator